MQGPLFNICSLESTYHPFGGRGENEIGIRCVKIPVMGGHPELAFHLLPVTSEPGAVVFPLIPTLSGRDT